MKKNNSPVNAERRSRFWTGLILILVGGALLADKIVYLPHWLFSWPMILILIGVVSALKHRFCGFSWLVFILIGGFFLADEMVYDWSFKPYFWPVMTIGLGLLFILRPKRSWKHNHPDREPWGEWNSTTDGAPEKKTTDTHDRIDSISILGGVKKVFTSKNFQGGDIVCFMGGAEINLSQADINGTVILEVTQAFGGTKIVVPPHWDVRSECIAIFAGVEDKRPSQTSHFDPNKILIIRGTTIFGGIDIKSY